VSKCRGINTALEFSRAAGHQVSSHGSLRSFSKISDRLGCIPGPMWSGSMGLSECGVGAVNQIHVEAGLATESAGPLLFVKVWLR
jgi:hypothetical protein